MDHATLSPAELDRIERKLEIIRRFRMPSKIEERLLDTDCEGHVKRAMMGNDRAYLGVNSKRKMLGW
jgi:hypothetical protein